MIHPPVEDETYLDWIRQETEAILSDPNNGDPIKKLVGYSSFVSKRGGGHRRHMIKAKSGKIYGPYRDKGYPRRWAEVKLVSYCGHTWSWHRFPADLYAREILKDDDCYGYDLLDRIKQAYGDW